VFAETYRPQHLNEVVGQDTTLIELRRWAQSWVDKKPAFRSCLITGVPGVGKTSAFLALARDFDWEVLEINASDSRSGKDVQDLIANAVYNARTYDNRKTLILIEECDEMTKGGLKVLENLIENTQNPVGITANDEYAISKITQYFRENSLRLVFRKLNDFKILTIARNIISRENIYQPNLDKLIKSADGDLRYVINNLEAPEIIPKGVDQTIFAIVHDIFRGEWNGDTQGVDIDFIWYTVKLNINNFYDTIFDKPVRDFVARIDIMYARMYRYQVFTQKRFVSSMLRRLPMHQKTAKIVITKSDIISVKNPQIAQYGQYCHMSYKKANSEILDMPGIFQLWKKMPKVKVEKQPEPTKQGVDLFSYEDSLPVKGVPVR
jgi:hypothetical protein